MLFSALPTNLGNRENRFPHSHRHDYDEKHVRKSPQRSLLKLPASNPPFRLISGLEKTTGLLRTRQNYSGGPTLRTKYDAASVLLAFDM